MGCNLTLFPLNCSRKNPETNSFHDARTVLPVHKNYDLFEEIGTLPSYLLDKKISTYGGCTGKNGITDEDAYGNKLRVVEADWLMRAMKAYGTKHPNDFMQWPLVSYLMSLEGMYRGDQKLVVLYWH